MYYEALALAKTPIDDAETTADVRVVANARVDVFCTYLAALSRQAGAPIRVIPPTFASLHAESAKGGNIAAVWVTVEDAFPEFSFRTQNIWDSSEIRRAMDERTARIDVLCDNLRNAIAEKGWRRVIIIPPFLEPPALIPAKHGLLSLANALPDAIRYALCSSFHTQDNVEVLDIVDALESVSARRLRDMHMMFRTGNFVSLDASRRIAEAVHARLVDKGDGFKCLVTDLDGTLWAGAIGEGSRGAVTAADVPASHHHHIYGKFLRLLKSEGIVLAIASKNNREDVEPFLDDQKWASGIGLCVTQRDFSAVQYNWDAKSTQIRNIAAELNIHPSACVLVDNDPYEIREVQANLPETKAILFEGQLSFDMLLRSLRSCFPKTTRTDEDGLRAQSYSAVKSATELSKAHGSVEEFLAALELSATFSEVGPDEVRPLDLVNKTNQFTLTGARYVQQEWRRLIEVDRYRCLVGRLQDRFGDHGIVLAALVQNSGNELHLHEMVVSCRVFNRGLETAFLDWLVTQANPGIVSILSRFTSTGRNIPARRFLEAHGFREQAGDPRGGWRWLRESTPLPKHLVATTSAVK